MPSINRSKIRRGTASGGIEENIYDVGNGAGSIAAYGEIDSIEVNPENQNELILTAKLASDYDDFEFSQDELICLRIVNNINIPTINDSSCKMSLWLKDSTGSTEIEEKHNLVKRQTYTPSGTQISTGSIAQSMSILMLCQQSNPANNSTRYYHWVSDNYTPLLGDDGTLVFT